MPIYEYECASCGKISEVIHKLSDPAPDACPGCGKGPMSKLMSASAFHLKGGGWYDDGYSSKKPDKEAEKDSTSKPESQADSGASEKKESSSKSESSETKPKSKSKPSDSGKKE